MGKKCTISDLGLKVLVFFISFLLTATHVFANGWTSNQPSHSTLYTDTITSKTDASSVNIADAQGLFVTGDITTLGRVGIGTTNPSQKLSVAGTIESTSGGFKFPDGTTQTSAAGNGSRVWSLNGTSAFYNNGKVGIGTTNPIAALHIFGNSPSSTPSIVQSSLRIQSLSPTVGSAAYLVNEIGNSIMLAMHGSSVGGKFINGLNDSGTLTTRGTGGLVLDSVNADAPMIFATGGAAISNERMRITRDGNVGIGMTNPTQKLDVSGNAQFLGHGAFGNAAQVDNHSFTIPPYLI